MEKERTCVVCGNTEDNSSECGCYWFSEDEDLCTNCALTRRPIQTAVIPRAHELKIWPQFFKAMVSGKKTYEVRVNDRAFQVGDLLLMREWDPETKDYTGKRCLVKIVHLMDSSSWYMIPNHLAIFGIELMP